MEALPLLIPDLTILLTLAAVTTLLCKKLNLPSVLGYILAEGLTDKAGAEAGKEEEEKEYSTSAIGFMADMEDDGK